MMCDQVSDHIDQLEALCRRQRALLESIFDAYGKCAFGGADWAVLDDAIMAARSASSMTGTDERGEK